MGLQQCKTCFLLVPVLQDLTGKIILSGKDTDYLKERQHGKVHQSSSGPTFITRGGSNSLRKSIVNGETLIFKEKNWTLGLNLS